MNYTYTKGFDNLSTPVDLLFKMNSNTGNILGVTVLLSVYIILMVILLNNGNSLKTSFASSTYVGLILAWLLWILNLIGQTWLVMFAILGVIALISLFIRSDS